MSTPPPSATTVPPGGPTVTVTRFVITGNSVFSDAVLQHEIAGYLGQALTLADLYKVADVITRYYQSRGYGLARATLPQQELSNGSVTLQVVEGRVGKLSVEGASRTRTAVVEKQASALKSGEVYTDAAMDRSILLVNDLPGVDAQVVLQPGDTFGTADAIYKVDEGAPYSGQLSVDNYGRYDTGRTRLNAEADVASLTGSGDRLSANLTHSSHNLLNFGGLTYSLPVGAPGGRLTAGYNESEYHIRGGTFTDVADIGGRSRNANLSYNYPSLRSRSENLYLGIGVQHEGSESDFKGQSVLSNDINLLQLTAFYNRSFDDGRSYTLSGSFATNGHKNDGNRPSAERARFELDGTYFAPISETWSFIGRGAAEWSPDPLPDTEKYSLGGPDNVRGYLSAEARGDSGFYASGELQHSFVPAWPLAIGVFMDLGQVWSQHFGTWAKDSKGNAVFAVTPAEVHTLSSLGAEIIFQSADKRWQSRVAWAYATGDIPSDGNGGGHIWATFGMTF